MYTGGFGGYPFGPMNPYAPSAYGVAPFGGGIIDDAEIVSYVRDNIDLDPYISVKDKNTIDVEVAGGVATLSGKAESRRSKGLAYADAFWAPGVLDVINSIKVEEKPRPSAEEEMS